MSPAEAEAFLTQDIYVRYPEQKAQVTLEVLQQIFVQLGDAELNPPVPVAGTWPGSTRAGYSSLGV